MKIRKCRKYCAVALLVISSIFIASCERRPKDVLSDDEMVSLLADLQLAEAYADVNGGGADHTSLRIRLADGVLAAHGVTKSELDSTLVWYGKNIDEYNELFKKVDKQLESRRRAMLADSESSTDESEGSVWPYSQHMVISKLGDSDNIRFSIPMNEGKKGDVMTWKLKLNHSSDLSGMIGVDYSDGATSIVNRRTMGNDKVELRLQTDSSRVVTRLFGVVRVNQLSALPLFVDSISLIVTPLDTNRYYSFNAQTLIPKLNPVKKKSEPVPADTVKASLNDDSK